MALSLAGTILRKNITRGCLQKAKAAFPSAAPSLLCPVKHEDVQVRSEVHFFVFPKIPDESAETNTLLDMSRTAPDFNKMTTPGILRGGAKASLDFEINLSGAMEPLAENYKYPTFSEIGQPINDIGYELSYVNNSAWLLYFLNEKLFPMGVAIRASRQCRGAQLARWEVNDVMKRAVLDLLKESEQTESLDTPGGSEGALTAPQRRLLEFYARDMLLQGYIITSTNIRHTKLLFKDHYHSLAERILNFFFFKDVTEQLTWEMVYNPSAMAEVPAHLKWRITPNPKAADKGPWLVTAEELSYSVTMDYCSDRDVRYRAWFAKRTVASQLFQDKYLHNTKMIEGILESRWHIANFLSYANFAELMLETSMAGSVDNVVNFLENLKNAFHLNAEEELASLQGFAVYSGFEKDLELWDIPYYSRLQRDRDYGINAELSAQLSYPVVLLAMFRECENLFGIKIEEKVDADLAPWQHGVRCYTISDSKSGKLLAEFFMDPYDRRNVKTMTTNVKQLKRQSAFHDSTPSSYLMFSFVPPFAEKDGTTHPSLLSLNDMKSLFFNFGMALEQLLNKAPYHELCPEVLRQYYDRDSAFVCGYVLQYLLFTPTFLSDHAQHWRTGDRLLSPRQAKDVIMGDRLTHALDLMQSLYIGAFDMEIHLPQEADWMTSSERLWREYMLFPRIKEESHETSLTPIFGDMFAGCSYYGREWSKMLAADIIGEFAEAGSEEERRAVGERFRLTYFANESSMRAAELFQQFKGRAPSMESYISMFDR